MTIHDYCKWIRTYERVSRQRDLKGKIKVIVMIWVRIYMEGAMIKARFRNVLGRVKKGVFMALKKKKGLGKMARANLSVGFPSNTPSK